MMATGNTAARCSDPNLNCGSVQKRLFLSQRCSCAPHSDIPCFFKCSFPWKI